MDNKVKAHFLLFAHNDGKTRTLKECITLSSGAAARTDELLEEGLIEKSKSSMGDIVKITEKGITFLKGYYNVKKI